MLPHLKGIDKEECWALYLNTACYLIDKERLTLGTGTSTAFDSRDILKGALDRRAYAVVLVHNHPSGNPSPSNSDQLMTKKLRKACDKLSVSLLDHVIVADDSFYSFNEDRTYSR
jgi:DNA repair protein RadC